MARRLNWQNVFGAFGPYFRRGRLSLGISLIQSDPHGDTQVIALSQSGETADTIASIFLAKSKFMPCSHWSIIWDSTIARDCDAAIDLLAGLEIGVASTKAYTAQLVNLLLYAMFLGIKKQILNLRR